MATKRALIWVAVSSKAQVGEDKASLDVQEREARALCERENWQVVDVLKVPGHSRRYYTIAECAADMRQVGIDAFDKLLVYLERHTFDVFICRDADRFGREASLIAEVTARIIDSGATVYALQGGGFVEPHNYRMWSAFTGLKAASEIDGLVKRRKDTLALYPAMGLPSNARVPRSHRVVRNLINGKIEGIELDENKAQLWQDYATLILEGIGWNKIENALFERFGHGLGNRPYSPVNLYKSLTSPIFWGHVAQGHNNKNGMASIDKWIFEPGHPVPDGVRIEYNVCPPVYTDELAEKVKAEIFRRQEIAIGKGLHTKHHMFTGLVYCGECGYRMSMQNNKYLRCVRHRHKPLGDCNQRKLLPIKELQLWFDRVLKEVIASSDVDIFLKGTQSDQEPLEQREKKLTTEISTLEGRIRRMIVLQASADEAVHHLYDTEIAQAGQQLQNLQARYDQLKQRVLEKQAQERGRYMALDTIKQVTLEKFWELDEDAINRTLHQLLGNYRVIALDGQIVGVDISRRISRKSNRKQA